MKSFLISIVSHGQNRLINELLCSLDKSIVTSRYSVTIVITQNKFDHHEILPFENLKIISRSNLRMLGFGANHNRVFEQFSPDLFMVVNPDILFKGLFDIDYVSDVALMSPGIYSPLIIGPTNEIADFRRKDLSVTNLFKRHVMHSDESLKFDWLAGMALLFPAEVYRSLQGFDESFFMYVEDCDLCMRARALNFEVGVFDDIILVHDARRDSRRRLKSLLMHSRSIFKYLFRSNYNRMKRCLLNRPRSPER
ncbi:COG1216 Predicted glycosyltransferases [Paracoccaceae bacterium]